MKKRSLKELKIEEKKLLWNSLVESNEGDKAKSFLDMQFFDRCFNIQRTRSLMPKVYGSRKNYLNALENMVDLAIMDYEEHGFEIEIEEPATNV
jgi:hypothetical protein